MARSGPGSRGSIQSEIRGLTKAEEITHTDLWTKSQVGESGQESNNDSPPELRHFREK